MDTNPTEIAPRKSVQRLHKWVRRVLWLAVAILAIVLGVSGGCLWWMRHAMVASLPQLDGKIKLAGLSSPVTVRRDGHGVPHIEAASLDDLLLAQGYVTGGFPLDEALLLLAFEETSLMKE